MKYCNLSTETIHDSKYRSYPNFEAFEDAVVNKNEHGFIIENSFEKTNNKDGLSIYIHLPFCESLCTHCSYRPRITDDHSIEKKYIEYLLKEWRLYLHKFKSKPFVKQIYVGGGTPTFFSATNLAYLIETILSNVKLCVNADLIFEAHVDSLNSDHLIYLYKMGFRSMRLGLPDFDKKLLQTLNRKQNDEDIHKILTYSRKLGYRSISFDLTYGLPGQTRKNIIDAIYKIREYKPDRVTLHEYLHKPHINPLQEAFENRLPHETEKECMYQIGVEMLKELGYFNIGMNYFVLKTDSLYHAFINKSIHHNLMGYTHEYSAIHIGLGTGAVSDLWNGVFRNTRNLSEYYNLIDQKEFPVKTATILSKDDLLMRKHILNLQRFYETSWDENEKNIPTMQNTLSRLISLVNQKLIKIDGNRLKVLSKGKDHIKKICMLMDPRMQHEIKTT